MPGVQDDSAEALFRAEQASKYLMLKKHGGGGKSGRKRKKPKPRPGGRPYLLE